MADDRVKKTALIVDSTIVGKNHESIRATLLAKSLECKFEVWLVRQSMSEEVNFDGIEHMKWIDEEWRAKELMVEPCLIICHASDWPDDVPPRHKAIPFNGISVVYGGGGINSRPAWTYHVVESFDREASLSCLTANDVESLYGECMNLASDSARTSTDSYSVPLHGLGVRLLPRIIIAAQLLLIETAKAGGDEGDRALRLLEIDSTDIDTLRTVGHVSTRELLGCVLAIELGDESGQDFVEAVAQNFIAELTDELYGLDVARMYKKGLEESLVDFLDEMIDEVTTVADAGNRGAVNKKAMDLYARIRVSSLCS